MVVHTRDNSNNSSPNTLLDHSIHAVLVLGDGDMVSEQKVVLVSEAVEEFLLPFLFVPFHPSPSFPFVVH